MTVTIDIDMAKPAPAPTPKPPLARPYPGLRPFEPEEWNIFRGREVIVRDLINRLAERNLVLVHGGSGCGKSSLIKAGVIPALEQAFAGGERPGFAHAVIRPSEGPFRALAAALATHLGAPEEAGDAARWWSTSLMLGAPAAPPLPSDEAAPADEVAARPAGAEGGAAGPLAGSPAPERPSRSPIIGLIEQRIQKIEGLEAFCLVVDQFEEIFAWTRDRRRSDVQLLADFLGEVFATPDSDLFFVILTMRSDYLGDCAQFPALSRIINGCQFYLPNLDERGIERAIVEPAAMFGGKIDPPLLARLMLLSANMVDPLPVLQHSLMRMAQPHLDARQAAENANPETAGAKPPEWTLTLEDLKRVNRDEAGRDSTALSVHANAVLAALDGRSKEAWAEGARWIFRSLLEVDVGGKAIRRPCDFQALVKVSGLTGAETDQLVDAFEAEGVKMLFVSDTSEGAARKRVDISHEALLRNWDRMTGDPAGKAIGWIQEEFEDGLTWRMLARLATDPHEKLGARTSRQVEPFMARMTAAPERARRYLLKPLKRDEVEEEPEWRSVVALIARSRRRALIQGGAAILVVLVIIASLSVIGVYYRTARLDRETAQLERQRRKDAEALLGLRTSQIVLERQARQATEASIAQLEQSGSALALAARLEDQLDAAASRPGETTVTSSWSGSGASGFIWTGDGRTTNLQTLLAVKVPGDRAEKGRTYVLAQPIKLRTGTPTPPNQNKPQIGALRRGTPILALEGPIKAPNGENWLKVRSITLPTIYLQYRSGSDAAVAALRSTIAARGSYIVPAAQQLRQAGTLREIRYCNRADAGAAGVIAAQVGAITGLPLAVKWIGKVGNCQTISKPGTIEVWLGAIGDTP